MKKTSIKKISSMLERAENPLYLYDDDAYGLCSYLLLKIKFKKGTGIPVKRAPKIDVDFVKILNHYTYDLLVILDKPLTDQEFIDKIKTPIVYLDHHQIQELKGVYYYNSRFNKNDDSPTTKICHDIVKQDDWIAAVGIVADWHLPSFLKKLTKAYPDLIKNTKKPEKILFEMEMGKLAKIFSFILKGDNKVLKECVSVLEKATSPYEILENKNSIIMQRFEEVNKIYEELLNSAIKERSRDKLLVFTYLSGKVSSTGELANELFYKFPKKMVVIAREKDNEMRMSIRGKNALKHLAKALVGINGYGGGHENACGGSVAKEDFIKFLNN